MKTTGNARQGARRAPAHQDAVALLGRILNFFPDELQHPLGVEDVFVAKAGHGVSRVVPKDFAVAVVPGVDPFVEFGGEFRRDAGGLGGGRNELGIQEFPAQALGKIVGELSAARAIFAFYGDDMNR